MEKSIKIIINKQKHYNNIITPTVIMWEFSKKLISKKRDTVE